VATGLLNPSDIAYPLRIVFRHSANVRFRQATVTRVELSNKLVRLDGAPPLAYDYLVLATGSTDNYFGNQEVARVSFGLKSLEDATRLRNQVLTCLERADAEPDAEARRALLTFVVVGGGPTGVESSGWRSSPARTITRSRVPRSGSSWSKARAGCSMRFRLALGVMRSES
jgi:NADH dehydrogenase